VARRRGAKAIRPPAVAGLLAAGVLAQVRALAVARALAQAGAPAAGHAGKAVQVRAPGAAELAAARTGGRAPAGPLEAAIARVQARPGRAVPRRGRAVPGAGPVAAGRTGAVRAHAPARVARVAGQELTGLARALTQEGLAGPARAGRPPPGPPAVAEAPGLPGPARAVAGDTAVTGRRPGMLAARAATAGRPAAGNLARARPGGRRASVAPAGPSARTASRGRRQLRALVAMRPARPVAHVRPVPRGRRGAPGPLAVLGRPMGGRRPGGPGLRADRRRRDVRGPAAPGLRAAPGRRAGRGLRGIPGLLAARRRRDVRSPVAPGLRVAPGVRRDRGLRADHAARARIGAAVLRGLAMQVLAGIAVARRTTRLRSRSTARDGPVRVPCPRCPRT
jgi:translation initiation factor IF-2